MAATTARDMVSSGLKDSERLGASVTNKEATDALAFSRANKLRNPHVADDGANAVNGTKENFTSAPTTQNKADLNTTKNVQSTEDANPHQTGQDKPIDGKDGPLTTSDRLAKIKEMLPSGTTALFGLSVIGLVAYASSSLDATDGVSANITSITIASSTSSGTVLTIAYDPPNALFNPCINDSIDLSSDIPIFGGQSGLKITSLPSTTSIQVTSTTQNTKTFPSSSSPSPILNNVGKFVDHTSIANQFTSSIVGVGTVVADTAAQLGGVAAADAGSLVGAAGGALGGAICSSFKILCNKWLWIGILILIVMGGVLAFMSKKN